jgi:lipooligosaccharide transport system permease protein
VSVQDLVDHGRIAPPLDSRKRFLRMTERNVVGYVRAWPILLTGVVEPFLYLLSIGLGVGALVGDITYAGRQVPYETFVASGMLATAAMNGAVFDTTFNFFIRLRYAKLYDAVLATPLEPRDVALGEVTWALMRGTFYSAAFLVTMALFGLTESWWAIAALPATVLIGAAFASIGLAGATYLRSILDFDFVNLAITPMFLFSATFFPLSQYPDGLATVIRFTPLYQGVALCRALTTGEVGVDLLVHVGYLLGMVVVGVAVASRRIDGLLRS